MKRRIKRTIKIKPVARRNPGPGSATGVRPGHDGVNAESSLAERRRLFKMLGSLAVFTIAFFTLVVVQADRIPADARQFGEHWLSVTRINQGLYCCRVYDSDKKLVKKQAYMLPYMYWRGEQRELTPKVRKYDGDTISLDDGSKLLTCEVPYQAELIQSSDGPVWLTYDPADRKRNEYSCDIYSAKNGGTVSTGEYVLKKYHWDNANNKTVYEDIKESSPFIDPSFYGGISIALKDKLALMPAGVIDYSAGPNSGLRVKYDPEGNEIQREEY